LRKEKIIFLCVFVGILSFPYDNGNYVIMYGNTFLVTNPYVFCNETSMKNIYYVTKVENKMFLGYVTPEKILFCNEENFIIQGTFKDFYSDIKCYGVFYSYINEDNLLAFFKTEDSYSLCEDISIYLYKRVPIYKMVFYKIKKIFL